MHFASIDEIGETSVLSLCASLMNARALQLRSFLGAVEAGGDRKRWRSVGLQLNLQSPALCIASDIRPPRGMLASIYLSWLYLSDHGEAKNRYGELSTAFVLR